jgi:GntR family transcriptional regulator
MLGTPAGAHPGRRGRPPGRSTLDPDSPLPLWAQLRADLRGRLARGEFDQRFPTERELTAVYEVSRHTVREAVRHLRADGLVERRRGLGTFVVKTEFEQPLGSLYSLFRFVEAQGVEQRSSVLVAEVRSDATVAGKLGLEPGSELFYLVRIRYAGPRWRWTACGSPLSRRAPCSKPTSAERLSTTSSRAAAGSCSWGAASGFIP